MKRPSGRNEPPFLMVGGPADGKHVETLGDSVRVPRAKNPRELIGQSLFGVDYLATDDMVEVVNYRKQFWMGGRIAFFVPVDQDEEETLRLLIQGYRQPKEEA